MASTGHISALSRRRGLTSDVKSFNISVVNIKNKNGYCRYLRVRDEDGQAYCHFRECASLSADMFVNRPYSGFIELSYAVQFNIARLLKSSLKTIGQFVMCDHSAVVNGLVEFFNAKIQPPVFGNGFD
jgi:hypothetical protein